MASNAGSQQRSRTGCYICKLRKVKCRSDSPSNPETDCNNCVRLGMQCRWSAPLPGEAFQPPPKRRRTGPATDRPRGRDPQSSSSERTERRETDSEIVETQGLFSLDVPRSGIMSSGAAEDLVAMNEDDWAIDWNAFLPPGNFEEEQPSIAPHSITNLTIPYIQSRPENTTNRLVQHYLEVMKGYAKVEDKDRESSNLYITAFSRALDVPPLFNAILAYSASHLGLSEDSYRSQSDGFASLARAGLDIEVLSSNPPGEVLLLAVFILIKRQHMLGSEVKTIVELLDIATSLLSAPAVEHGLLISGSFIRRVILRLAYMDCRAALFRLGRGSFVSALRNRTSASDLFKESNDIGGLGLLRANLLRLDVADIDRRWSEQKSGLLVSSGPVSYEEVEALRHSIHNSIRTVDSLDGVEAGAVLDASTYNRCLIAGALHSAQLYLYRILPTPLWNPEDSIRRVLALQLLVSRDPSRADTPSSIWPSSLLLAGVTTSDIIYREWIINHFQRSERWGSNIYKCKELLREVIHRQSRGQVADIATTMQETTGTFIL